MDWFLAAIVSAITLSGQALAYQRLQKHYAINVYMTYAWLGAAMVLGIIFLRPDTFPAIQRNLLTLVLSGFASLVGSYAFNRSIRLQSNIGYIEAIMSWRLILTYAFSIIVLNASFEAIRLGGVILIVCGVLAVSGAYRMSRKDIQWGWFNWALLGGLAFGLLTIFVRYANDDGVSGEVSLVIVLIVAGVGFLLAGLYEKSSFKIAREHIGVYVALIAFAAIGNAALFIAFAKTPNLAYAIAIDNSRMILLYVVGLFLFDEKWQWMKALGIAFAFAGILLLN